MAPAPCAMVAFEGTVVDESVARSVADPRVAGVTLYRSLNIESASQTQRLTAELVDRAGRPLLIGVDQEGGQLIGAGGETTQFAGNMALGATRDPALAFDVAQAIGRELRAIGVNVDYAPVADIATRPGNPSLGIRSFGEDPTLVSTLTAAMVRGLQSTGVAATIKHFPGKGEATVDPHYELPVLDLDRNRLDRVEFAPFRAGIEAGAQLVMVGHYGLPAFTGDRTTPASVSPAVLSGLLRNELGFEGLIITDALDMGGFRGYRNDSPLEAGADLLLYGPAQKGELPDRPNRGGRGVERLHAWLATFPQPSLEEVGSHTELAAELARRAITLVKDDPGTLPLRLRADQRILAVMPRPIDLTPADTSSLVQPGLAGALRPHHPHVTEMIVDHRPGRSEVAAVAAAATDHDLVIVGTLEAGPEQAVLVNGLLASGKPVIAVGMRVPDDLIQYPKAPTYMATYGIHQPSMEALATAVFGLQAIEGKLPISIPGHYPVGHGLELAAR